MTNAPPPPGHGLLRAAARVLNDGVMGFLAMLALALALVPALFATSPAVDAAVDAVEWGIVALFALEYAVGLLLADDRRAYVLNPWRILDLVCIAGAVASLLPRVSDTLRSSPVLRLLRILRAALFGTRAGAVAVHRVSRSDATGERVPMRVSVLRPGERLAPEPVEWTALLRRDGSARDHWYHVSSLDRDRFDEAASAAGMTRQALEAALGEAGYPRIEVGDRFTSITLWLPEFDPEQQIRRTPVLLAMNDQSIFTLSARPSDLHGWVAAMPAGIAVPDAAFPTRMTYSILKLALQRYEQVVGHLEQKGREHEEHSMREPQPQFFEETFPLKKRLFALRADLWRLKGILNSMAEGRVRFHGLDPCHREFLRILADEADYLYETVANIRESLISLIELRLNVVSFDMNRVMRLLAVVSVLGLVPAIAGGLFGMNLAGNPWPLTLPQVAFGVSMGMLGLLYVFYVKGWLK
ncbi:MAG: ion transporter [Planctomycetes bacterium]|nr:ion transporter [Planctomycetota bacterium]